jgi:hypothetical protein
VRPALAYLEQQRRQRSALALNGSMAGTGHDNNPYDPAPMSPSQMSFLRAAARSPFVPARARSEGGGMTLYGNVSMSEDGVDDQEDREIAVLNSQLDAWQKQLQQVWRAKKHLTAFLLLIRESDCGGCQSGSRIVAVKSGIDPDIV